MKKIVSLLLLLMLIVAVPVLSEEVPEEPENLTIENCADLFTILELKNEFDQKIKDFAKEYVGQTIEFDGHIGYINNHGSYKTRYDILIGAWDYSEETFSGPNFQFSDVGIHDLGLSDLFLPDFVTMGSNIHIIAKVVKYNEMSGLFILDPVLIGPREIDKDKTSK
jgi:hypothetical protein